MARCDVIDTERKKVYFSKISFRDCLLLKTEIKPSLKSVDLYVFSSFGPESKYTRHARSSKQLERLRKGALDAEIDSQTQLLEITGLNGSCAYERDPLWGGRRDSRVTCTQERVTGRGIESTSGAAVTMEEHQIAAGISCTILELCVFYTEASMYIVVRVTEIGDIVFYLKK